MQAITATLFDLTYQMIGSLTRMDTGSGLSAAGPGTRTRLSAGQPIIMDVGSVSRESVGVGFRDMNGLLLGFHGGKVTPTEVGLLFLPKPILVGNPRFRPGPTPIMILDRLPTFSCVMLIGLRPAIGATASREFGTCGS